MAEQLLYEDQQNNCSNNSQDIIDDNPTDDFNYKTINCQDINGGDYKSNICNISPNNNVFVGDMVSSPCYSSELECNTNSVNSASVRLENTPTSSSPASGLNPYSNSSTPGNFGESDTYSESSQGNKSIDMMNNYPSILKFPFNISLTKIVIVMFSCRLSN